MAINSPVFLLISSHSHLHNDLLPLWRVFKHMLTPSSHIFKISFLRNVPASYIPLTFQGTLPTSLLNRPKSVLHKSRVAVVQLTPHSSENQKLYNFAITVPKIFSDSHIIHKSFSVHKHRCSGPPPLAVLFSSSIRKPSPTYSRNLLGSFISVVL